MDAPRPLVWSIGAGLILLAVLVAALAPGAGPVAPLVTLVCGAAVLVAAFVEASVPRREAGTLVAEREAALPDARIARALHPPAPAAPSRPARTVARTHGPAAEAETGPAIAVPVVRKATPAPIDFERRVDEVIRTHGVRPRARQARPARASARPRKASRRRSHGRRTVVARVR
jgi:hypothetical protein